MVCEKRKVWTIMAACNIVNNCIVVTFIISCGILYCVDQLDCFTRMGLGQSLSQDLIKINTLSWLWLLFSCVNSPLNSSSSWFDRKLWLKYFIGIRTASVMVDNNWVLVIGKLLLWVEWVETKSAAGFQGCQLSVKTILNSFLTLCQVNTSWWGWNRKYLWFMWFYTFSDMSQAVSYPELVQ